MIIFLKQSCQRVFRIILNVYFVYFQSVIQMPGFRSLGEGEEVEFESKPSDKGVEATFVSGPTGNDCKGSDRRPLGKKKFKKLRYR